jgi:hypothetical protein
VRSVNAEARPDLRAAIMDGSFQVQTCPSCETSFRVDPLLTYLDMPRRQWILVQPAEGLATWPEGEQLARAAFDKAFGAEAPRIARAVGTELEARVAFGWPALSEKLLCTEYGLVDTTLELLKCAVLRTMPESPLADDRELRLIAVTPDTLRLAWLSTSDETASEVLEAPRALYDEIADNPAWQDLRSMLSGGFFVDMERLFVGES